MVEAREDQFMCARALDADQPSRVSQRVKVPMSSTVPSPRMLFGDIMGNRRRIEVHLATDAGSKFVGTIRALEDGPLRGALAMSRIRYVNLRWDSDQILAIEVQSLEDVDTLKALGFEAADQKRRLRGHLSQTQNRFKNLSATSASVDGV
jgi:hypothetical protein